MLAHIKHYRGNHKNTPGRPLCWSSCGSETFHTSLLSWTHNPETRCCLPDVRSFCRDSGLITINFTSNQTKLSAINKVPGYFIFLKPNCDEVFVSWQLKMVLIEFLKFVHGYLSFGNVIVIARCFEFSRFRSKSCSTFTSSVSHVGKHAHLSFLCFRCLSSLCFLI